MTPTPKTPDIEEIVSNIILEWIGGDPEKPFLCGNVHLGFLKECIAGAIRDDRASRSPNAAKDKDEFYKECCELLDKIKAAEGKPYLPFSMNIARLVQTYGPALSRPDASGLVITAENLATLKHYRHNVGEECTIICRWADEAKELLERFRGKV